MIVFFMLLTNSTNTLEMTLNNLFILIRLMQKLKTGNHSGNYQKDLQLQFKSLTQQTFFIVLLWLQLQSCLQKFIMFHILKILEKIQKDLRLDKKLLFLMYNSLFHQIKKQNRYQNKFQKIILNKMKINNKILNLKKKTIWTKLN